MMASSRSLSTAVVIVLFSALVCTVQSITTTHHDKPEEAKPPLMASKMRKEEAKEIKLNATLAASERQKRLLPYMTFYLEHDFNRPQNQVVLPNGQRYQLVKPTTFQQFHNKFNELTQPKFVETPPPVQQNLKYRLTPFSESNAIPGPFLPMRNPPPNTKVTYTPIRQIENVPNYSAIYDKLSQLKLQQQVQSFKQYNQHFSNYPKAPQNQNYIPVKEAPPSNAVIQTYTAASIDIPSGKESYEQISVPVKEYVKEYQPTTYHQDHVQPITAEEQRQYMEDQKYNTEPKKQKAVRHKIRLVPQKIFTDNRKPYPQEPKPIIVIRKPVQKPQYYEVVPEKYGEQIQFHPLKFENDEPKYLVGPKYQTVPIPLPAPPIKLDTIVVETVTPKYIDLIQKHHTNQRAPPKYEDVRFVKYEEPRPKYEQIAPTQRPEKYDQAVIKYEQAPNKYQQGQPIQFVARQPATYLHEIPAKYEGRPAKYEDTAEKYQEGAVDYEEQPVRYAGDVKYQEAPVKYEQSVKYVEAPVKYEETPVKYDVLTQTRLVKHKGPVRYETEDRVKYEEQNPVKYENQGPVKFVEETPETVKYEQYSKYPEQKYVTKLVTTAPSYETLKYPPTAATSDVVPQTEDSNSLSLILKKLQDTNALPHTLTPDNIDNSIRTLVRILSSLKKQQKFNSGPIIVPDESGEYEDDIDNEAGVGLGGVSQIYPENTPEGGTPGKPGVDYPALSTIPQTSFNCKTQRYKGFFGDPDTHCQVWHYCDLNGGQASFLCPNGTIFSQVALTCDWWYNVKCSNTAQLYVLNERLYKYILPLAPKFPEDYSGPLVDRYLALKFQEMEEKMKRERKKNKEHSSDEGEESVEETDDADELSKEEKRKTDKAAAAQAMAQSEEKSSSREN